MNPETRIQELETELGDLRTAHDALCREAACAAVAAGKILSRLLASETELNRRAEAESGQNTRYLIENSRLERLLKANGIDPATGGKTA